MFRHDPAVCGIEPYNVGPRPTAEPRLGVAFPFTVDAEVYGAFTST